MNPSNSDYWVLGGVARGVETLVDGDQLTVHRVAPEEGAGPKHPLEDHVVPQLLRAGRAEVLAQLDAAGTGAHDAEGPALGLPARQAHQEADHREAVRHGEVL